MLPQRVSLISKSTESACCTSVEFSRTSEIETGQLIECLFCLLIAGSITQRLLSSRS